MLKHLTSAQQEQIPHFVDRWAEISLSTDQVSDDERIRIARNILEKLLDYWESVPIILSNSPKSCWKIVYDCFAKFKGITSECEEE